MLVLVLGSFLQDIVWKVIDGLIARREARKGFAGGVGEGRFSCHLRGAIMRPPVAISDEAGARRNMKAPEWTLTS